MNSSNPSSVTPEEPVHPVIGETAGPYGERPWLAHYATGVPHDLDVPDVPLTALLARAATDFGGSPAINFYGRRISYGELAELVARFAAALGRLGVKPHDRVGIMLPNVPQAVIAYFGILQAGAVVVQTNPLYTSAELDQQMTDSGARVLVALDLFRPRIAPLMEESATRPAPLQRVIYCGIRDYLPGIKKLLFPLKARRDGLWHPFRKRPPEYAFTDLLSPSAPAFEPPSIASDDVAALQYTGGTTGTPKGVMLTHRNLVANTLQCAQWIPDLHPGKERLLGVIPFFHVYGMTTCMNLAVHVAGEMILLPKFQPKEVLKAIAHHRPTLFPGIQAMYLSLGNHPDAGKFDLSSIRSCISGAGPLQDAVRDRFTELTGASMVEGYGLSEASPVTHANPIGGDNRSGCIGLPFPGTDARVVDEQGNDVAIGDTGELWVRGPQVMYGYWNRSEETLSTLSHGWLHTGDMAVMDTDGYFRLVDRKKDMIKTGGENVYPREVEEVLFQHPKVLEAVVAGLPDDFLGEKIRAYVVLTDGETATADEIIDFCTEHLARFKVPREVEFREELPKTIVGKVLRRVLIEEAKGEACSERDKQETVDLDTSPARRQT